MSVSDDAIIRYDGPFPGYSAPKLPTLEEQEAYLRGRNCSTGCLTKDHLTWGECVRGKRMQLNPNLADTNVQKSWDRELDSYESAVRQGVQPDGTKQHQVDAAMRKAEAAN